MTKGLIGFRTSEGLTFCVADGQEERWAQPAQAINYSENLENLIEHFHRATRSISGRWNIAFNKTCSISSHYEENNRSSGDCSVAINGNTDTYFNITATPPNCIHTAADDYNPLWSVDLGQNFSLHSFIIYGRRGLCNVGWWGSNCQTACSQTCQHAGDDTGEDNYCDSDNGTCVEGCADGWFGSECTECGHCANNSVCDKKTGVCPFCDGDFVAPLCVDEKMPHYSDKETVGLAGPVAGAAVGCSIVFLITGILIGLCLRRSRSKQNTEHLSSANETSMTCDTERPGSTSADYSNNVYEQLDPRDENISAYSSLRIQTSSKSRLPRLQVYTANTPSRKTQYENFLRENRCADGWFGSECTECGHCANNSVCDNNTGTEFTRLVDAFSIPTYVFTSEPRTHALRELKVTPPNCIMTAIGDYNPLWLVDLGRNFSLHSIIIYGRRDRIDRMDCAQVSHDGDHVYTFPCPGTRNVTTVINLSPPRHGRVVTITRNYTTPGDYSPFLNICEVQIWVCQVGWWGSDCQTQCSQTCQHTGDVTGEDNYCDSDNGACVKGCADGWFGSECTECGHCANNSVCDKKTGVCPFCDGDFVAPLCLEGELCFGFVIRPISEEWTVLKYHSMENTCTRFRVRVQHGKNGCADGWFGSECTECGHCANNSVCDKKTGVCPFCDGDFVAPLCLEGEFCFVSVGEWG
ncbi:hypothetical protein C0Q70_15152 [Pomacea canaliculata]|uniref:Fucolectin tachylectin-4 pentraxin-1 domain-containing protein n=1 Tax=Pomacea canaliculata TaxID=400727 RepID=A0A2T7NU17_POMCA|nr:hypothetical protein C0Q70_15152 [Pomacea canaliculata]